MKFNPEIFRAYDIRGVYGRDFDEEFAFGLGMALVQFIGRDKFLMARDERAFSKELSDALAKGMMAAGADIIDLGISTTPFFNFVFKRLGLNGGVVVTASHLGPEYGGFKIFGKKGEIVGLDFGLARIKEILERGDPECVKYGGTLDHYDKKKLVAEYIDFIIKQSKTDLDKIRNIKIKMDAPQIAEEEIAPFLAKTGLKNYESGHDIMFQFDSDADRLNTFNKTGEHIHTDLITGLLVKNQVGFWSKPVLVHDLRFSRGVLEKLDDWRIKRIRSRVGRAFLNQNSRKYRADMGGELSGHMVFKLANYQELPLLAMLRILNVIGQTGRDINSLVAEFKTWENSGEINVTFSGERSAFSELAERIKEKYQNGRADELDGITVEYADWWFNARSSNTEPVLRLVVEAKTKGLLEQKTDELTKLVSRI